MELRLAFEVWDRLWSDPPLSSPMSLASSSMCVHHGLLVTECHGWMLDRYTKAEEGWLDVNDGQILKVSGPS